MIATCPGGSLPPNVKFAAYASKSDPQLLLHSSDHDTIDFTAVETRTTSTADSHLKHYVAVYDPATNNLRVTEAKRVAIRSQVRQYQVEDEEEEVAPTPQPSSRAALTEAFGTKKSKKAVQAIAENRLIARGSNGDDDPLSQAIQSTVAIGDAIDAQPADGPVSYKPLPQPNLATEDIREVYPLSTLVFPSAERTLKSIPVAYWTDRACRDKPIKTSSHFISNRVGPLFQVQKITMASETQAHAQTLQQIQLLRYLDLLLQIHRYLASHKPGKSFPAPSAWPEKTIESDFDMSIVRGIVDHMFPERRTSRPAMSLFRATILAITLQIPPAGRTPDINILVAEPTDIIRDLAIDSKDVFALYRELGCQVGPLGSTEMSVFGLDKLKGATDENGEPVNYRKVRFAKLKLPLEFPKVSQGRRERRR